MSHMPLHKTGPLQFFLLKREINIRWLLRNVANGRDNIIRQYMYLADSRCGPQGSQGRFVGGAHRLAEV